MSDSYQAIYDAVRSRISGGNISDAVEQAIRDAQLGDSALSVVRSIQDAVSCYTDASAIYRPTLSQDGNAWLAIYGDLPTGVVGCGDTPAQAMADFNRAWYAKAIAPPKA